MMYNHQMGRWMTRDPSGEANSTNLYDYCDDDPVNETDSTGLWHDSPDNIVGIGGADPVHEAMSLEGAKNAGYGDIKDSQFISGLRAGTRWPDFPDGAQSLIYLGRAMNKNASEKARMAHHMEADMTYRSQYGDLSYWHAMAPPAIVRADGSIQLPTADSIRASIVDWIVTQYQKALDAKNNFDQGFEIGKALHTIEDSYSIPHVQRVWRNVHGQLVPMEIQTFQDYNTQNAAEHSKAETLNPKDTVMMAAATMAIAQSGKLLQMLHDHADKEAVRKWLTEGDFAPFNLSKTATAGGNTGVLKPIGPDGKPLP